MCDRWHTGFVDAAGAGGLLARVEGRSSAVVIAWPNAQPQAWRAAITHVTIDFSASYAKAVREALPNAVLVVDQVHGVQLGNDMLTQVRQRVIRQTQGRRGRPTTRPGSTGADCSPPTNAYDRNPLPGCGTR